MQTANSAGTKPPPQDGIKTRFQNDLKQVFVSFGLVAALGFVGAILYSLSRVPNPNGILTTIGGASLIAGASAFVGGLVGFLFAIPRSRQGEGPQPAPQAGTAESTRRLSDYAANTNLEQISDWLTKILVGISLVQFRSIADGVGRAASTLAPLLGTADQARPAVLALMTYFSVCGFFFAYLATRLWLPKALSRAETEEVAAQSRAERIEEVQKRQTEREVELHDVEERAYSTLYKPPPEGFRQTIEMIEGYLDKPGAIPSASLSLYLSSAYGQMHALVRADDQAAAKLAEAKAVSAVKDALRLGPWTRPILEQLFRGEDPRENDLVTLRGNDELEALLGDKRNG